MSQIQQEDSDFSIQKVDIDAVQRRLEKKIPAVEAQLQEIEKLKRVRPKTLELEITI